MIAQAGEAGEPAEGDDKRGKDVRETPSRAGRKDPPLKVAMRPDGDERGRPSNGVRRGSKSMSGKGMKVGGPCSPRTEIPPGAAARR